MNIIHLNKKDIIDMDPCREPPIPDDWTFSGTVLELIEEAESRNVSPGDILWLVMREGFIDEKTTRLFAVWCARQALATIDNPDKSHVAIINVAERYANGEATYEEFAAARKKARWKAWLIGEYDIALASARDTSRSPAWTAARCAHTNSAIVLDDRGTKTFQLKKLKTLLKESKNERQPED